MITRFSGRWRFLSNFYPSPISVGGIHYPTVEHAYQALKSRRHEERLDIANAETPGQAKRMGRAIDCRPDWDEIKVAVMLMLLRKKFAISNLRSKLIDTDRNQLIEGNTWGDTYWGVCGGEGKNLLGKLLMQVRREISR